MKKSRPEARNPSYDVILSAAREAGRFTRADLMRVTGLSSSVVGTQVRRMLDRNHIRIIDKVAGVERMEFHQVRKLEIDAESPQQALWMAMRANRRFTPIDLIVSLHGTTPTVSLEASRNYCQALLKAGYLDCKVRAIPGRTEATYFLCNDSGPFAPVMKRVTVLVDPNEQRITWVPEVPA